MIYKVSVKTVKGHTSEFDTEADSPETAIELGLEKLPFDVLGVWCEVIDEAL